PWSRGSMPMPFSIVAIDGPSSIGKSTLLPLVGAKLRARGVATELSSNIDGAPFSAFIRKLLQDNEAPYTVALMTAAARAFLCEQLKDTTVLCDRFVLSTLVYQAFAGVPRDYLWAVNGVFAERAIHVVLQIDAAELAQRRAGRGRADDDWFKRNLSIEE